MSGFKEVQRTCKWVEDSDGVWRSGCDNEFTTIDGTPSENGMRFCPFCGGDLVEVCYQDLADDPGDEAVRL